MLDVDVDAGAEAAKWDKVVIDVREETGTDAGWLRRRSVWSFKPSSRRGSGASPPRSSTVGVVPASASVVWGRGGLG